MNKEEFKIAIKEEKKEAEAIISDLEKIEEENVREEDKKKFSEIISSWESRVYTMLVDFFEDSYVDVDSYIRVSDSSEWRYDFKYYALRKMNSHIRGLDELEMKLTNYKSRVEIEEEWYNTVLIVYGYKKDELIAEMEGIVKDLGMEAALVLKSDRQKDSVFDMIDHDSIRAAFGIVVYPGKGKIRSGQDMVFEHGYVCGKLGREHVCAFVEDEMKDNWQAELKEKIIVSRRELALANIR